MEVRRYEPRYHDELLAFLSRVFAPYPHKSEPPYFEWLFTRNPLGSSLGTYLLLVDGERVVGQIATLRDRVRIDGGWHECVWIVDLIVDPAFRGGPGVLRLFREAMRGSEIVFTTGVDASILRMFEALRWTRRSVTRAKFAVLRPGPLLALAGGSRGGVHAGTALRSALAVADLLLPVAQRLGAGARRLASRGALHVEDVPCFGPALEGDIARLTEQYAVAEFRSAAVLNWKFTQRPVGRQQLLVLREPTGAVRGVMVLKWMTRPSVARWIDVADYLAAPNDLAAVRRLTAEAVARAAACDFDFVRMRLSWPEHVRALRRPLWVDHTRPVTDDVFFTSRDPRLREALTSSPWHLTALAADRVDTGRDEWPASA